MNRRVIAAIVAVLLAAVGAVLVSSYVAGAEERAMAGQEPATVLVVAELVPAGTAAEQLADLVVAQELPATAVVPGALSDLDALSSQVTTADLHPGEQLLATRFVDPESLAPATEVEVPAGLHGVSVLLDSQRVLGGHLTAGAAVGVFFSMTEPAETHLALHKVLVTRVQGGLTAPVAAQGDAAAQGDDAAVTAPMPQGSVMVTLAVDAADAERVVFAAEFGTVWLSLEDDEAPESGTRIVTRENVYE